MIEYKEFKNTNINYSYFEHLKIPYVTEIPLDLACCMLIIKNAVLFKDSEANYE